MGIPKFLETAPSLPEGYKIVASRLINILPSMNAREGLVFCFFHSVVLTDGFGLLTSQVNKNYKVWGMKR